MNIAQLQTRIAKREKRLITLQRQHDFIANSNIKAKYAQEIEEETRGLESLKQQLETTFILEEV